MRRRWLVLMIFLVWSSGFLAGTAAGADLYFKVTELPLPEGCYITSITGLNNLTDVAGNCGIGAGKVRAVFWDHNKDEGVLLPLLPGCDQSAASGINDSGQVVGYCFNLSTYIRQPCLWQGGAVQVLAPPAGLGEVTATYAFGINNLGQVAGSAYINGKGEYPMLWDHGPAQPLEDPPQTHGSARFISNNGVLAVNRGGVSFCVWTQAGGFVNLDPAGAIYGISGTGRLVGDTGWPTTSAKPCVWNTPNTGTVLAPLEFGYAYGINDPGQIVGVADYISFLWQGGQVTDLNKSLLGYDWNSVFPSAINNSLQIAATAVKTTESLKRAVLLNPVTKKPRFRLTDLGANRIASGINDAGEVVGSPPFLWKAGQLKSLGGGHANAINIEGKIVGSSVVGSEISAVCWDRQGNMTPLEKSGARRGEAHAVNDKGMAAGYAQNGGTMSPCIWKTDGTIQFLTSDQGAAYGISNNNLAVGYHAPDSIRPAAFACTVGGGLIDLLPGLISSRAYAVNLAGQVVGGYGAFLWEAGKAKDLTIISSVAYGINRAGKVVGSATKTGDFAFLWESELGLMNLNELLEPPQPDWNLTVACGINENQKIIGQGKYQGVDHSFILERVGTCIADITGLLLLQ